jgi:hypothetical protein
MAFVVEMLELHRGNISVGLEIEGNPTDILRLQQYTAVRENATAT